MAQVLSPRTDSQNFYSSSPHSFYIHNHHSHHHSDLDTSTSMLNLGAPAQPIHNDATGASQIRSHGSSPSLSSRASTSDLSNMLSMVTPPSSIGSSLEDKYRQALESEDDYPQFDTYDGQFGEQTYEHQDRETDDTTASDISLPTPTVVDDTAMRQEPSQHVDYLSHDWKEEDVWSSWRHIVSQRRVYGQQSRLENAAWRTWVKNKYQLRTVSPEALNWLKESDVTWLYGPLKPAQKHPISQPESAPPSRISKNNSFTMHKKPILKKRSMSEVMLQRSISTSSLLKQAAASVQAQGRGYHRRLDRAGSEYISSGVISEAPSREGQSSADETASSGIGTPSESCKERKHIRFDDTVEQCIAVEAKHEEDDDESEDDEEQSSALSSSSSDEGLVMMRKKPRRPGLARGAGSGRGSRSGSHQGRKTIETLPSTTLKYRIDSPDVSEEQQQAAMARSWGVRSPRLSSSSSQETLRPARPSRNFLLGSEEEIEEEENTVEDHSWSFGANNPRSSLGASANSSSDTLPGLVRHDSSSLPRSRSVEQVMQQPRPRHGTPRTSFEESLRDINVVSGGSARQLPALQSEPGAYGMEGMRRTESGMFMPEDDEDDIIATGLFGRISETVNTARDIAHVIWNVGWRK